MPEIIVPAADLSAALGWVARAIPSRPSVPALAGCLLEERDGALRVFGQDGMEMAAATVTATGGDGKFGKRLVSGRLLADIAKTLPRESMTLTAEGTHVVVSSGRAVFRLPTLPLKEYPSPVEESTAFSTIRGTLLADAARRVGVCAGKDDALPILTAVLIQAVPAARTLRFVATDRFRLACREIPYTPQEDASQEWSALVTARDLDGYTRLLASEETIRMSGPSEGANRLGLGANARYAAVRVLDGDFPKWEPVLERFASTGKATFDAAEALAAAKRVALVSGGSSPISVTFDPVGEATLSSAGNDSEASEAFPCSWDGEGELGITFNGAVLSDALSSAGSAAVLVEVSDPTKPALLTTQEEHGTYRHLLMPLRG